MRSTWVKGGVPNMKGKESYRFFCGCCNAYDFRERERAKEVSRELRRPLFEAYLHPAEIEALNDNEEEFAGWGS